jgi:hypothetical protein
LAIAAAFSTVPVGNQIADYFRLSWLWLGLVIRTPISQFCAQRIALAERG